MTKVQQDERALALDKLREMVKPGDTVYTILRHVARSGMSRHISCVIDTPEGPFDITYYVARALGYRIARDGGIVVSGSGMDMGFHVVYNLSRLLFPDGFPCLSNRAKGVRCPSTDHHNGETRRKHPDGGYALDQRWL